MKRILSFLSVVAMSATPVFADPEISRWKTPHAMGCMMLRECTEGVHKINTIEDLKKFYPGINYSSVEEEFSNLVSEMNRIGIGVFLSQGKYFQTNQRGVYHTVGNNFFLNMDYMIDPSDLLAVTRHEGWHAAQDCMAGTIDNNNIAIIFNEEEVPTGYHIRADVAYAMQRGAIPWEREAMWAGETADMTVKALSACQNKDKDMWEIYKPTPMTGEWLINNGFWNGK